jgi:hypothetical protein
VRFARGLKLAEPAFHAESLLSSNRRRQWWRRSHGRLRCEAGVLVVKRGIDVAKARLPVLSWEPVGRWRDSRHGHDTYTIKGSLHNGFARLVLYTETQKLYLKDGDCCRTVARVHNVPSVRCAASARAQQNPTQVFGYGMSIPKLNLFRNALDARATPSSCVIVKKFFSKYNALTKCLPIGPF